MIKGHFINLDAAKGRLKHMTSEVERLSLPLFRLPAVNGQMLDDEVSSRWLSQDGPMHHLSKPELACFLSHRAAWELIATGEDPFGAVFEDDLTFSDDALRYFETHNWIPEDAELVKIETTSRKVMLQKPILDAGSRRAIAPLVSKHLGAGGYVLSREFAQKLLVATDPITVPVDYALFDPQTRVIKDVSVWQLDPAICVQQVRTREKFLPDTVETSGLDAARANLKRHGKAKIMREVLRPLLSLNAEIRAQARAIRDGCRWAFIKFRR